VSIERLFESTGVWVTSPAMDIHGLGWRTDLALLEISGSVLEHRGDHVVVRTPDNPTFWWGNFLLLATPPTGAADARQWLGAFEAEFPAARHRTFGIDGTSGTADDARGFAGLGLQTEVSSVMTATSVHEPPRPNREARYRPLESDDDWEQQVELTMAGETIGYDREFSEGRARAHRRLVDHSHGQWWGAFEDGRLLSSMGLFRASPGLARFQTVKTRPDARGRGLAGTLVHQISRFGFAELDAVTLVMVADPEYLAIRVYRSVGFAETEVQVGVERKPPD
jgi:ribosomal protein S18 acetylase RimI-like enzyme